jgi:glycosyltransferase involved in cell wall biosynthesis
MHILHVTPYYAPAYAFGGVVRAVEGLAQAMRARGHRITVLTTDAYNQSQAYSGALESDENGVRVLRARNLIYPLRGRLNLSTPLMMRRLAAQVLKDVDVVHLHELRSVESLIVAPLAAQRGIPIVLSPHGTLTHTTGRSGLKRLWDRWLSPRVMRHVHAVVGLTVDESAEAAAMWRAVGLSPLVETIPNGIHADEFAQLENGAAFRARYGLGKSVVCLFMGRLHARKGVDVLARAFTAANVPNARLVFAGPDEGMLAMLQSLAAADPRIILTGFLDGADRLAALAAADVFALPATGEGLSMAALEAMAAGLPLLLSPGCHLPEAGSAGAALIVEPQVAPLTAALQRLLTDVNARSEMGAAAQRLVRDTFAWDTIAARWERVSLRINRS